MTAEMAQASLTKATTAIVCYLRAHENVSLFDLVENVRHDTTLDEATVKAAALRLDSEGQIKITADWTVHLVNGVEAAA